MSFLPVIAATFLIFQNEGRYLRLFLPLLGVLAFTVFSLDAAPRFLPELATPSAGHPVTVWVNTITGVVSTCAVVALLQTNLNASRAMESEIRHAIAKGEFYLQYQPQVDSAGRIQGAEALLRWKHGKKGNIPPSEFIALAEETGLIIPIGEWVLRTACAQLAAWAASPLTAQLTVSVNVSASQFRQPDFVEQVRSILRLSGACPELLKLELTESALAEDAAVVCGKMRALKELGISWSLDDFGTGYSSLSSLKQLPFDQLKIDQSFVRDLLSDDRNLAIVSTILTLGQSLGLEIIAEGSRHRRSSSCCMKLDVSASRAFCSAARYLQAVLRIASRKACEVYALSFRILHLCARRSSPPLDIAPLKAHLCIRAAMPQPAIGCGEEAVRLLLTTQV
ncbi:putative bifunctional diguanylate cyclase/phosphodiesterase [Pannonibacter phragmitetus]|uniref:putative bifunctional diguanylate cyclase/phosphodiesterase n=1 Tax=Pannonibacter phragmitetus TaxID=121719 RepID=UPI003D2F1D79